ncbi:hypothetical protein ACVW01_001818 [Thermostichus sp. MS-CIW-19]|jgi:hypothetical protein|uniref:hypothetical protein n=1 Tax=unclassified Synechococcus TaxID=2626047 RepID=UPI000C184FB3|nr:MULTISPECIES: hypothetical protein [unclassified Synechococcus]PIK85335.1 hypothetical protein SYN63AY4M2_02030 [Synechococcus sp. 63AY4M2]PIK88589.1 hypothetical protein SYN65AY6A5_05765 [Synechococcus sp. 65AY6A5]PIK94379.1 hypothetical protein SYN60AY4M2_02480 [Synechococcus sp. 60AY4M2]PIL00324.1 hypothetical protein SYN65AY640_00690 [Synechococcus sp. 65AY640]
MTSPALSPDTERRAQAVWKPLRQAIVESSGFRGWLQGRELPSQEADLDRLVHRYLEQTLSHLAY